MSADVPAVVDAWRMVAARRRFEGQVQLSALPRLSELLSDPEGRVDYVVDFDRDDLRIPYAELRVEAKLPLLCQRTLQRFFHPVDLVQRLGLLPAGSGENEEAALPFEYEPYIVAESGEMQLLDLVEDELILAVPLIPVSPGSEILEHGWRETAPSPDESASGSPFAALSALKRTLAKKDSN